MNKEFDYYLISLKGNYIKKFMISGTNFFISLTNDEEEAYQFFEESEADDINHYYCNDQGEVLYFEAKDYDNYDFDEGKDEDWEEDD